MGRSAANDISISVSFDEDKAGRAQSPVLSVRKFHLG